MTSQLRNILAGTVGILAVCGALDTPQMLAQPASPFTASFEVASVRPAIGCDTGGRDASGSRSRWSPGRLSLECQTVDQLIRDAYLRYADGEPWPVRLPGGPRFPSISERLLDQPIKGSPAWIGSDRYTIEAKTEGTPGEEVTRGPMLQRLLEDRFKLKIHRETREVPVYELTVATGRPKLSAAQDGSCIPIDRATPQTPGQPLPRVCGGFLASPSGGMVTYHQTMASLCWQLSVMLDRDCLDKTGIAGIFDIHFDIDVQSLMADVPQGATDPDPRVITDAFRAALSKLGLKLEPAKGPAEFLVIDHVEKPSDN